MDPDAYERLIQAAVQWIRERSASTRSAAVPVTPRTQLLREGILDSLGLVDLVAFLEQTSGGQVDLLELDEVEITTLDGLCRAVLETRRGGAAEAPVHG